MAIGVELAPFQILEPILRECIAYFEPGSLEQAFNWYHTVVLLSGLSRALQLAATDLLADATVLVGLAYVSCLHKAAVRARNVDLLQTPLGLGQSSPSLVQLLATPCA